MANTTAQSPSFITNRFGDRFLEDVNKGDFETESASDSYQRALGDALFLENNLFVIAGTDSGLLFEYISNRKTPSGTRYLFVEVDHVLPVIQQKSPTNHSSDSIRLIGLSELDKNLQDFDIQNYTFSQSVKTVRSIAANKQNQPAYNLLANNIEEKLKTKNHEIMRSFGGLKEHITSQLYNIADNITPAVELCQEKHPGTAIVLAAGPSLDLYLPWVIENREQLYVIAVSRISQRLQDVGITPDMVLTVDHQRASYHVSKAMLKFPEDVVLVSANHATLYLVSPWTGPAYYLDNLLPWNSPLNTDNVLNNGPTVTHSAIALALKMKFDQILLAGVDLCFSSTGHTHAKGSIERDVGEYFIDSTLTVETYSGNHAVTDLHLGASIQDLEQITSNQTGHPIPVYNLHPDSAKVDNIDHLATDKVQLSYKPTVKLSAAVNHKQRLSHCQALSKEIALARKSFSEINKLAIDAKSCVIKLYSGNAHHDKTKYQKRIDKIEKQLQKKHPRFLPAVQHFGLQELLQLTKPASSQQQSDQEALNWGRQYYQIYENASSELLAVINDVQKLLNSRIEENREKPNAQVLSKLWANYPIPPENGLPTLYSGNTRITIWAKQRPDLPLSSEQQEFLEQQQSVFNSLLNDDQHYTDGIKKQWYQDNLLVLLNKAFLEQDISETQTLVSRLKQANDLVPSDMKILADAYLADLENDKETAAQHYLALIDFAEDGITNQIYADAADVPWFKDVILRLHTIFVQQDDLSNAVLTANMLSSLSIEFMPEEAHLQHLNGDNEAAAATYVQYLELVPTDDQTMLKLGDLYLASGAKEAAKIAFEYVIRINPNNSDASKRLAAM